MGFGWSLETDKILYNRHLLDNSIVLKFSSERESAGVVRQILTPLSKALEEGA
jgi:hypothetical protein